MVSDGEKKDNALIRSFRRSRWSLMWARCSGHNYNTFVVFKDLPFESVICSYLMSSVWVHSALYESPYFIQALSTPKNIDQDCGRVCLNPGLFKEQLNELLIFSLETRTQLLSLLEWCSNRKEINFVLDGSKRENWMEIAGKQILGSV